MLHSGMVLAAPQSGSGKTTITCALLAAMKNRKLAVRAFKSGPDYIDPMFHRQVIGVPSRNLDTFFSGADQIRELYGYDRESFSYSVIEGAMGLYDGLGGTQKEGSAYHLACQTVISHNSHKVIDGCNEWTGCNRRINFYLMKKHGNHSTYEA